MAAGGAASLFFMAGWYAAACTDRVCAPLRVRTASAPTAVPTPVDGHSCASLVSAAMSGAAMNRRASFGLDSSGYLPRSEISGSYGSS